MTWSWKTLRRNVLTQSCTVVAIIKQVWHRFFDDHCQANAAALSYTTVLSLVPFIAVALGVLSIFPEFQQWQTTLQDFVLRNFVPTAGDVLKEHLDNFTQQVGKLTAVGSIFLIVSALLLLYTIEETFNQIWHVHKGRTLIQRVLVYWAVLTLGPLLIGASLSLTSYLVSIAPTADVETQGTLLGYLPFVFEVAAFVLLYTVVPNRSVPLRFAVIGGVVAAFMFELTKRGFALYVLNVKSYQIIYGALATVPIFLVWVYLSWLVVLVGGVLVAVLSESEDNANNEN